MFNLTSDHSIDPLMEKIMGYAGAVAVALVFSIPLLLAQSSKHENERRERVRVENQKQINTLIEHTTRLTDTNQDRRIDNYEWARVYNVLGIEFDPSNPRKLTVNDLEKYIQIRQKTSQY